MSLAPSNLSILHTGVPLSSIDGLIVICGATATGKSGLAIALAERLRASRLNSAILSADSRQVYREFNIGTAKPSLAEQNRVPHYLIDICEPTETLTVADYQFHVQTLIGAGGTAEGSRQQAAPGEPGSPPTHSPITLPLLVGGTGLYIRSITKGLKIPRVPPQPELRSQLQLLGQSACYAMLQQVDPPSAHKIHPHDQVRTLRSLEVFYVTGCPMSEQQGETPPPFPILQIGLDCAELSVLQRRIADRANQMVADGFVAEVEYLCGKYGVDLPLMNTLGYAEFRDYLSDRLSLDAALEQTILHTRQFAKRQRTWFRADANIHWFDAAAPHLEENVWQRITQFLVEEFT